MRDVTVAHPDAVKVRALVAGRIRAVAVRAAPEEKHPPVGYHGRGRWRRRLEPGLGRWLLEGGSGFGPPKRGCQAEGAGDGKDGGKQRECAATARTGK